MKYVITGAAGQDGTIMSRKLIASGHQVFGICKGSQSDYLKNASPGIKTVDFDLAQISALPELLNYLNPDVIVNLAGFSSVWKSWNSPTLTFQINTLVPIKIMEWIIHSAPATKFIQASSSEIFGGATLAPQNEGTLLSPITPYGSSKAAVHEIVRDLRSNAGLHFSSAILYNHESPLRKADFVSKHIVSGVARIKLGIQDSLYMGNIKMSRDWGWAPDYVDGMIEVVNQPSGNDYIFASGISRTVQDFIEASFLEVGIFDFQKYVKIAPDNERKIDPSMLVGNSIRARTELLWNPKTSFSTMVNKMIDFEIRKLQDKKDEIWFE
jgi:GDPmannose 4,6-dehydratase